MEPVLKALPMLKKSVITAATLILFLFGCGIREKTPLQTQKTDMKFIYRTLGKTGIKLPIVS